MTMAAHPRWKIAPSIKDMTSPPTDRIVARKCLLARDCGIGRLSVSHLQRIYRGSRRRAHDDQFRQKMVLRCNTLLPPEIISRHNSSCGASGEYLRRRPIFVKD
jgi:hypothetical protein